LNAASTHYAKALDIYETLIGKAQHAGTSDVSRLVELKEEHALLLINLACLRIDERQFSEGIKLASTARAAGEELGSALIQCGAQCTLATLYVYAGAHEIARTTIEAARKFDVPQLNHEVFVLFGIIAFRQKDIDTARRAFLRAVEFASSLTVLNPSNYKALDTVALSEYGLVLCGMSDHAAASTSAYRTARKINSDSGVMSRLKSLFAALTADAGVDFFDLQRDL
jgi:hypothetical protein